MPEPTASAKRLVRMYLIHRFGTDDEEVIREEFRAGAAVVDDETIELIVFLLPGHTVNYWFFQDTVMLFHDFLQEYAPEVTAEMLRYFGVIAHEERTEVRVRVRLGVENG